MRCKILSTIFLILFMMPLAVAEIQLNEISQTTFSWGDNLEVSGTFVTTQDFSGLIRANLVCDDQEKTQLFVKTLRTSSKYSFKQSVPINVGTGDCHVEIVADDGENQESQNSEIFTVNNELEGTFEISKKEAQLGENITLSAAIFKTSNQNTEGSAVITIKKEGETYLLATESFKEESLVYSSLAEGLPAGEYTIDISATDVFGNSKTFENVKTFTIYDSLKVTSFFNNLNPKPGEILLLEGTVRTIKDDPLSEGIAEITVDGKERLVTVLDGKFSYDIEIPSSISSYNHTVEVVVEDDYSNIGEKSLEFYIEPVATSLKTQISQTRLLPGQELTITPKLTDQAGDLMESDVKVTIVDANRMPILDTTVTSNQPIDLTIEQFSVPGTWVVNSQSEGLTDKQNLLIDALEEIETNLIDQKLIIRNTGNVRYKKDLVVEMQSNENAVSFTEKVDIFPNETKTIKLYERAEDGNYTVTFHDKLYPNVVIKDPRASSSLRSITGGAIGGGKSVLGALIFLLILGGGIYVYIKRDKFFKGKFFKKKMRKDQEKVRRDKDFEEGRKMREKIQKQRESSSPKKKFSFGKKSSGEDNSSYRYRPSKPAGGDSSDENKSVGMFNIFK